MRKLDVERLHVGVQTRILHRQHDGVLVTFVVVRVPPAGRRHKGATGHPVGAHGVNDVAIGIQIAADHGVNTLRGLHRKIEGDGVVPVRLLFAPRRQQIVQRPHRVRQRLRLRAVRIRQQDAVAVLVLPLVLLSHLLQLARQQLTGEIQRPEPRTGGPRTQEIHQRLVIHPVEGAVLTRAVPDLAGHRQRKQIARFPAQPLAIDHAETRAANHIKHLAAGMAAGGQLLTCGDVHKMGQKIRPRGRVAGLQLLRQIQRNDLALSQVMHRRRKHINADLRHARIRRAAILKEQAVLLPGFVAGRGGI